MDLLIMANRIGSHGFIINFVIGLLTILYNTEQNEIAAHVLHDIYHKRVQHHPELPPHWDEPDYVDFLLHTNTYEFGREAAHGMTILYKCQFHCQL